MRPTAGTTVSSVRNTAKAMIEAVIITSSVQPTFNPTYKFEIDITPPISMPVKIERNESCRAESPW